VGIVGFVTAHAEPRIALDVGTDAVFFDNPDLPDTRSEMALPLLIGSRVIGALDVQSTEPAAFVEEDVEVMRVLADQVAIAIENTRLFETTRRALADAELIYSQYVRQEWQKFNLELPIIGYQVTPSGVEAIKHPIEKSEIRTALKSGKSSTVAGDQPSMTVPLVVRGEVIGVINIRCRDSARRLNENDALIVQAVAERAAMALENYRLLQDAQRRALRERAIGEVSTKITAAPEMDAIMRTTVQELGRRLGEAEVIFQLSEPQEEQ